MQDINQFTVTGVIEELLPDNRGWVVIKICSHRKTKDKTDKHLLSITSWGENAGDIRIGDDVLVQGYLTGREIQKKDGGKFIAESRMALNIKKIGTKTNEQDEKQQKFADEEIPF